MKITSLTCCCVDFFPELDKIYVGGNSLNFAVQCMLSGINDVSVIGAVGNDKFGALIEQYLDNKQIDRSHLYRINSRTASNKIYISEKGDRYFKDDSWDGGAYDIFRLSDNDWRYLDSSDIIAMPASDPNLRTLLNKRNEKQLVAIDFLDYHAVEFIENLIEKIDIVFLSAKEEMSAGLKNLSVKSGKLIVATLGAKGSIAFYKNSSYCHEAVKVDKIVDTTGCGDAFQAAFAIEWFKSKNINSALNKGSLAAGKVLSFVGGVE